MLKNTKKGLFLISFLLFISCTTTSEINNKEQLYRMDSFTVYDGNENILQIVNISYNELNKPQEVLATAPSGEIYNRKTMEYTESGKIKFQMNSRGDSQFVKTEYHYNESDFLIEVLTVNEEGTILGTNTYNNDEYGNPTDWISEYNNNERTHFMMEYDDQNRIVKSSEFDNRDELIYYSVSEYDESGNEISYTIYSPEGIIDQQLINIYADNELIGTEVKDELGNILFYTKYEMNDNKDVIKISSYNQYNDLTEWIDMNYDDMGFEKSRKSYDYEGKLKERIEKEYDINGNILSLTLYNSDDEIVTITTNSYKNNPLNMDKEEFNALVFKL